MSDPGVVTITRDGDGFITNVSVLPPEATEILASRNWLENQAVPTLNAGLRARKAARHR